MSIWWRRILVTLVVVAGLLGGLVMLACWNFDQPPAAYRKAPLLQVGMPKDEVIRLLGRPDSIAADRRILGYSRWMGWGLFSVEFDDNWKFQRWRYDP